MTGEEYWEEIIKTTPDSVKQRLMPHFKNCVVAAFDAGIMMQKLEYAQRANAERETGDLTLRY